MSRTGKEWFAYIVVTKIERDELTGDIRLLLLHPDSQVEAGPKDEFARVALAQNPWRNEPTT